MPEATVNVLLIFVVFTLALFVVGVATGITLRGSRRRCERVGQ